MDIHYCSVPSNSRRGEDGWIIIIASYMFSLLEYMIIWCKIHAIMNPFYSCIYSGNNRKTWMRSGRPTANTKNLRTPLQRWSQCLRMRTRRIRYCLPGPEKMLNKFLKSQVTFYSYDYPPMMTNKIIPYVYYGYW